MSILILTANGTNVETGRAEPGWDRFESLRRRSGAKPPSLRTYAEVIGSIRKMAGKPLLELSEGEVEALDEALLGRAKVYRNILKMFFGAHKKRDLLDAMPRQRRKAARLSLDQIISPKDVMALIAVADNKRDRALIAVLAGTGARIGEIVPRQVKDLRGGAGGYQLFVGKKTTGQERYTPKIDGAYKTILDEWIAAIPDRTPESWLFPSMKTEKVYVNEETVRQLFSGVRGVGGLKLKAGITKKTNPHQFRHHRVTLGVMRKEDTAQLCIGIWGVPVTPMLNRYAHFAGLDDPEWTGEVKVDLPEVPDLPQPAVDRATMRLAQLEREMAEFREAKPVIRTAEDFEKLRDLAEKQADAQWDAKSPAEKNVAALEQERDEMRDRMLRMEATLAALLKERETA
jgi:integrase